MSESVKVCDGEIKSDAKVAACWDDISAVLAKYVNILGKVTDEAVKAGEIHDTIERIREHAESYYEFSAGLGGAVSGKANGFISKIDSIDLDLYSGG